MKEASSPLWIQLPLNPLNLGGGRLSELTDWASNQAGSSLLPSSWTSLTGTVGATAATVGAAMGLWWMWSHAKSQSKEHHHVKPIVNPECQTRQLKDGSRVCSYLTGDSLMRCRYSDATTLYEAVRRGAKLSKDGPMLGYRKLDEEGQPYRWLSYSEVIERALNVGRALRALGQAIGPETFIGVYSKNRPEWVIVENAVHSFSNVLVPLYDTLGADACTFVINQAQIEVVVCDAVEKARGLLKERHRCPSLKHLILITDNPDSPSSMKGDIDLTAEAEEAGIRLITFSELEELGRSGDVAGLAPVPPKPEDLCTICYTSGTTGTPKGVMLTHGNVIADCGTLELFQHSRLNTNDVMMSYLPLAHMFEKVMQCVVFMEGGSVGFFRGDIRLLVDDIRELHPTILPVVPRVLNRLYDKVQGEVSKSAISKLVFDTAIAVKSRELNNWIIRNNSIVDQLVFKKIRETLGGRVRLMITGSAPCSETVLTFIRCAMGCSVVEGYGQTECVAAATVTIEGDFEPGHVGVPSPCNAVKLIDAPELGYYAKDNAGEVCIKGTNVFQGYYKMPKETAEALDADGWLHTGDIGRWTERGTLKIVDRKKHIFKLAQGEYVAPEKIENIYTRSKYVAQCFVHGDSLKACLVGVVVPDAEILPAAVRDRLHLDQLPLEDLCHHPAVIKLILADINEVGKKAGLYSFEQVKAIHLCAEAFSVENDLLTPTMKSRRPKLKERFGNAIQEIYARLD